MLGIPEAKAYLIDLDGTLIAGGAALAGAAELVSTVGDRMVVVSNDSEHVPAQLSLMLAGCGLQVPPERMVLAGTTAIDLAAREYRRRRVLLLASPALQAYARGKGLRLVRTDPDLVILARDRGFTYAKLMRTCGALAAGADLLVANPDLAHPGPHGPVPETGALLAAMLACAGPVPYRVVGKPEPALFETGLSMLGAAACDALMIGDNAATDGAGASRLGIRYLDVSRGLPGHLAGLEGRMLAATG